MDDWTPLGVVKTIKNGVKCWYTLLQSTSKATRMDIFKYLLSTLHLTLTLCFGGMAACFFNAFTTKTGRNFSAWIKLTSCIWGHLCSYLVGLLQIQLIK